MGEVPLDGRHRPRDGLDPRRARGDDRRLDRAAPDRERQRDRDLDGPDRDRGCGLRRRSLRRRALLRPAHRPLRPEEALPAHARRLHPRHARHGGLVDGLVLLPLPLPHRSRHRRRVRSDQLGDRRADPGAGARPRRSDHQRLLLGRRRVRLGRRDPAARQGPAVGERRLAARVPARRRDRTRRPRRPPQRAREPALALHPRPRGGGRSDRPRHRTGRGEGDRRAPRGAGGDDHREAAREDPVPRDRQDRLPALSAPRDPRPRALHRPGIPLQRRHLQPRHALLDVLGRLVELRPGLPDRLRGRQLSRPAAARASLRHGRTGSR